jgi:cytochrome c
VIASIPVSTKYTSKEGKVSEAEDGLLGVVQDPNFEQNHWIYLYYSPEGSEAKNIVARYELRGTELVMSSKKVLLEIAVQREECCHTGGGMVFDDKGNLYLSTGDNTSPRVSGFTPIDERPGREPWDAQKSSSNTNDLRGKIIRIHPETDGGYTIPEGNLFPKGTPKTRPEIYVMGLRNPWRLSIDSKTGFLYWGEVGPDMKDSVGLGPDGFDDFNQARKAGNYGWPYFVGNNAAYWDRDFATGQPGERFNPAKPVNNSPNNTGLTELPPAQGALIWYSYKASREFPLMGSGGRSAVGGPIFHKTNFKNAGRLFPDYYEGKWFITDFIRGWIMAVTMDEQSKYVSMERFMPDERFDSPIDMKFGADGDLYLLEYGSAWFKGNDNARLVRIEYNGGNRKPVVQLTADKTAGALPLKVSFSAEGSKDFDKDALTYEWRVTSASGGPFKLSTQANPIFTFDQAGVYTATLTVTDAKGEKSSKTMEIKAGNEPPVVAFDITKGNKTFFFPDQEIDYAVSVSDKEDGSLANGKINPTQIAVSIDYMPEGFDMVGIAQGHRNADASARFATGLKLIEASDCKACHTIDKKSVGPAYKQVAEKYKGDKGATDLLAKKVISGGSGVWGEVSMSAHPQLSLTDATQMVKYILSLSDEKADPKSLPVKGSYTTKIPEGESDKGYYVLRAAYADKGTKLLPSLTSEDVVILRNPVVMPDHADKSKGMEMTTAQNKSFYVLGPEAYLAYTKIDLTSISQIEIFAQATTRIDAAGGTIEVHLDSPTGKLIGKTPVVEVKDPVRAPSTTSSTSVAPGNKTASSDTHGSNSPAGDRGNAPNTTSRTAGDAKITGNQAAQNVNNSMVAMLRRRSPSVKADITSTSGVHDVYLVFKNNKAGVNQVLMQLSAFQFIKYGSTNAATTPSHK